jgi:hypothetical protein
MNAIAEQLKDTTLGRKSRLYVIAQEQLATVYRNAIKAQRLIAEVVTRQGLEALLCGAAWHKLNAEQNTEMQRARQDFAQREREITREFSEKRRALVEVEAYKLASEVAADMNQGGNVLNGKSEANPAVPEKANLWSPRSSQTIPASAAQGEAVRDREGMGHTTCADGQHAVAAPPRDTDDDEAGLTRPAEAARDLVPAASSPELDGGSQVIYAPAGPLPCAPSRETETAPPLGHNKPPRFTPGHARRGASAIASVQHVATKTLLDTFKVRDGRVIGDLLFKELEGLRAANAKEAAVLRAVQHHTANAAPMHRVRDIVSPDTFAAIVASAEEEAHAA